MWFRPDDNHAALHQWYPLRIDDLSDKVRETTILISKTFFLIKCDNSRFMSMTSQTPQFWLTSHCVINLTTGMVGFSLVYGIGATICNAVFEWNIFPTYTVCLVESEVQQELDNSVALAFFVMPSVLLAYTTPIIDLVTVRLMTSLANQSRQIPKGTLQHSTFECKQSRKHFHYFRLSRHSIPGNSH